MTVSWRYGPIQHNDVAIGFTRPDALPSAGQNNVVQVLDVAGCGCAITRWHQHLGRDLITRRFALTTKCRDGCIGQSKTGLADLEKCKACGRTGHTHSFYAGCIGIAHLKSMFGEKSLGHIHSRAFSPAPRKGRVRLFGRASDKRI